MKHGERMKQLNEKLTANQIRQNKCDKVKARNAARKAENIKKHEEMTAAWRELSPSKQLICLQSRMGECKKQRAKVLERMESSSVVLGAEE